MSAEGAEALAEALKTNATLLELYLQGSLGHPLCDEGDKALAKALETNKTLHLSFDGR